MSRQIKYILAGIVVGAILLGRSGICVAQKKAVLGSEHEATYKYDTPGIQLEGVLTQRKVYGPPGYGETPATDLRSTVLVLKLSRGISVEPKANPETNGSANLDPARSVREMQLFVSRSDMTDARKLVGRVVTATGTLNESVIASQYTKVWLDVAKLEPKK